jgi:hypothetical protein
MISSGHIAIRNNGVALDRKDRVISPAFSLLLMVFLCWWPIREIKAQAQSIPDLHHKKLVNSKEIAKRFEQGSEKIRVIVGLAFPSGLAEQGNLKSPEFVTGLRSKITNSQSQVLNRLSAGKFTLRNRYKNFPSFAGDVSIEGLTELLDDPLVESVEPSLLEFKQLAQGIPLMNAAIPRSTYNGQGIAIAVSDTGVDYTHPKLGGGGFPNSKVIGGYDAGDNDSNPMPQSQAHGTCCGGIAAGNLGTTGDYIGGVAYNAKIYAMKITSGTSGSAWDTDVIEAWDWCITHQYDDPCNPIMIITHSFGGGRYYSAAEAESARPSYASAANRVAAAGITLFASSGNDGYCDSLSAPAAFSSVISVGAVYDASLGEIGFCIDTGSCTGESYTGCSTTGWACFNTSSADMVTCYSNTASFLDILAPSHDAYTTDIAGSGGYSSGDYVSDFGGTSAACPYAAGAAACLQSAAKATRGSYLAPSEVRAALILTGDNITDGKVDITKPRINLGLAIESVVCYTTVPTVNDIDISMQLNTPVTITLLASDDGEPNPPGDLSYIITSLPSHGNLSDPNGGGINSVPYTLISGGNQIVYTPNTGYSGLDNFTFKANDGGIPPCGGDSGQANVSINVITPGLTIFLTEGFEFAFVSGAPPGWTKSFKTGTVDWTRSVGDNRLTDTAYNGTYNAMLYYAGSSDHETYLVSPVIDFGTGTTDTKLTFWHKQVKWPPDQDTLSVYYKTSAGGSWTLLTSYTTNVSDWTKRTISLPNPGSAYYIGFLGNAKWGYGVCIDDVQVTGIVAPSLRTLTVFSTLGGHTEPNEGSHQYSQGTIVDINAIPNPNYHFVNWTGDTGTVGDVNASVTTITMNADYAVQANFAVNQYTIIASAGANGLINPGGAVVVNYGGSQDFNAVPSTGYEVDEWYLDGNSVQNGSNTYSLSNITANHTVYVTFKECIFTIYGYVLEIDGSTAVEGVLIQTDDNDINSFTDANGYYELSVNYGWSGIVTPQKEGYLFEPNSSIYTNVAQNYSDVNYTASLITFKISGYVFEQDLITPVIDVNICAENGGGQWTSRYGGGCGMTDVNGYYEVKVDYNWDGNIVPTKYAYGFEPNFRQYADVNSDQNDQDYTGRLLTFAISGYIRNDCNVPIACVLVDADAGGGQAITDINGFYEVWVNYGWSGTVTPTKKYYIFVPSQTSYVEVLADCCDQNYIAHNIYDLDCDGSIGFGDVAVISENWMSDSVDVHDGDFNDDDILNFLDFAEFGIVWKDEEK